MAAICSSVEEVVEALNAGADEHLIGLRESVWFDAESSPYRLDEANTLGNSDRRDRGMVLMRDCGHTWIVEGRVAIERVWAHR